MIKEHTHVWKNCLELIKKDVTPQSFKTWFEPIIAVKNTNDSLTIQVPNKFFYEWLEEHYIDVLKRAIKLELGDEGKLEYQILVENHRKIGRTTDRHLEPGQISSENIKNPFVIPGIKKITIDPQLNKNYTFANFIEGDCNKLSRSASLAIAKDPGGTSFNPLFLYGDVGLGKTHLAQAVGNEIIDSKLDKQVLYVTMERFTNQVVQAIKNNAVNDFMNFYQCIDLLIVDDIQFLAGRPKTQEIFFNIFNTLHQSGKQIILTSDRPPIELKDVEDRLISRFKWGLAADLQSPELETRLAILLSKIEKDGLEIPSEVVDYIAYNVKTNVRELEGVLISVIAQSTLTNKQIDINLAEQVIKQYVSKEKKEISIFNISEIVANFYQVELDKIISKTRKRQVVIARQLSMFLAKKYTNHSLKHIGDFFGGRDHSTVIYSIKTVEYQKELDPLFRDEVDSIEKKIKMEL